MIVWPEPLWRLRDRYLAQDAVADLRHDMANRLTGMGAIAFRARRHLVRADAPSVVDQALGILSSLEAAIREAGEHLATRYVPAPAPDAPGLDLVREAQALVALLPPLPHPPVVSQRMAEPLPQVRIDRADLQVALLCLVEIALDPDGRHPIAIECHAREDRRVQIRVADAGPGTPGAGEQPTPATADRLGPGLAIARRIAHRWGGELLPSSEPPPAGGTAVTLVFPPATGDAAS